MLFPLEMFDNKEFKDLSSNARLVLMDLFIRANGVNKCWPSISRLEQDTGLCERSIFNALKELSKGSFIIRETRIGSSSIYSINTEKKNEIPTPAPQSPPPSTK